MEESGHYYTVYFTSLAVGFAADTALRHAVIAQMPDQIGHLDATDLHVNHCIHVALRNQSAKANEWRFLVEYVLHSLPDSKTGNASSAHQSAVTRKLLLHSRPDSLEFGLLLHRLGDTYAHRIMYNEKKLYTTSSNARDSCLSIYNAGHFRDMHEPDYPFVRANLFYAYLDELYEVLQRKFSEKDSFLYRRGPVKILSKSDLVTIFRSVLDDWLGAVNVSMMIFDAPRYITQRIFIQKIREQCHKSIGVTMAPYAPEKEEKQTLKEFLAAHHHELQGMGINETSIRNAIKKMSTRLK